jgi:hypothetical protein
MARCGQRGGVSPVPMLRLGAPTTALTLGLATGVSLSALALAAILVPQMDLGPATAALTDASVTKSELNCSGSNINKVGCPCVQNPPGAVHPDNGLPAFKDASGAYQCCHYNVNRIVPLSYCLGGGGSSRSSRSSRTSISRSSRTSVSRSSRTSVSRSSRSSMSRSSRASISRSSRTSVSRSSRAPLPPRPPL